MRRRLELQHPRQVAEGGVEGGRAMDAQGAVLADRRAPPVGPGGELPLADLGEHRSAQDLGERLAADVAVDAEGAGVGARADDVAVGEDAHFLEDRPADERRAGVARFACQGSRQLAGTPHPVAVLENRLPRLEHPARRARPLLAHTSRLREAEDSRSGG